MSTKEAMLDSGVTRRRSSGPKAGSVWETRMKLDDFKGGIKVFNANHQDFEQDGQIVGPDGGIASPVSNNSKAMGKQSPVGGGGGGGSGSGKRKTWKSDRLEGSPVRIGAQRSEVCKNLDDKFKDSADGNAGKIPVLSKKSRPVSGQLRKMKSDSANFEQGKVGIEEFADGDSKNSAKSKDVGGSVAKFDGISSSRSEGEPGVFEVKEVANNAEKIKNPGKEEEDDKKIEVGIVEKNLEIEQMSLQENKPKKSVNQEKKLLLGNQTSVPNLKQQLSPAMNHTKFHQNPTNISPNSDSLHGVPRTRSKLQCFGDLIMWRDVAKSSFIFGIGTFAIVSSSYTKDLNTSFISVVSYMGLAYVGVNFLFRSLISRGSIEDYVIGEEEAISVIKWLLPYVNEFLLKLRALFSGDPATTMKLAVLLFGLARCGSSITMWKMAKLGFIGVFTVPKLCSSYSAYVTFWIRRLSDVWESCSHKKAVGFAIFSLVWNLSSVIARIWTVFMLCVAFKCYQHSSKRDQCEREQGRSERDPNLARKLKV